jgi:hypothetical protein
MHLTYEVVKMNQPSYQRYQSKAEISVIFCFIVLIAAILLARTGQIAALIFPVSALLVGAFLQQRNPALYVGFTWWLWFLSPVIRRMIDFNAGTYTYGPWHLTPMLVTSLSIIALFRHGVHEFKGYGTAIIISAIGVIYGACVTYIQTDARITAIGTLGWLSPIAFCFYIYINWRSYPQIKNVIHQSFLWGMMIMGPYGIYQYIVAPGWDCFYLNNPNTTKAFGLPEPFGIRVFGTMEAPHTLGATMAAGCYIIMATAGQSYKYIGLVTGLLTILLTSARTIWISLAIGLFLLFPGLSRSRKITFVIVGSLIAYSVYSLAMSDLFYETITKRFESLQDSEDGSFTSRRDALISFGFAALTEIIGKGFDSGKIILEGGVPVGDNGIFLLLISLGLLGGIPYIFGFSFLTHSLFKDFSFRSDNFLAISKAVVISTSFQSLFVAVTESAFSMVLWGFLGIGLASIRHSQYQIDSFSENQLSVVDRDFIQ